MQIDKNDRKLLRSIMMQHYPKSVNSRFLPNVKNSIKIGAKSDSCADQVEMQFFFNEDGVITNVRFEGNMCAIATAATDILCDTIKNKSLHILSQIIPQYEKLVATGSCDDEEIIGELIIFCRVNEHRVRQKCASLALGTLKQYLNKIYLEKGEHLV